MRGNASGLTRAAVMKRSGIRSGWCSPAQAKDGSSRLAVVMKDPLSTGAVAAGSSTCLDYSKYFRLVLRHHILMTRDASSSNLRPHTPSFDEAEVEAGNY